MLHFYLILLLIFLLPAFFITFTYDTFEINKLTLLRITTIILIFLYLTKRNIYLRKTILDLPIIIYISATILSTIFSISPWTSVLGIYSRFEGLLTIINYIIIYYLAINTFTDDKRKHTFSIILIISGLIPCIYGIIQYLKLDPIRWASTDERIFSTLGYSNLFASYLVLILPFSIIEIIDEKRLNLKILFLFITLILFINLIFTYSRGGYLGFLLSFIILLLLRINKLKTFLVSILILLLTGFIVNKVTKPKGAFTIKKRIISIVNLQDHSILERIDIWKSCIKIVKDNPISGVGVEALYLTFPKYKSKYGAREESWDMFADKAHNELLNKATTGGFIYLFAYLFLVVTYILKLLKKIRNKFIDASLAASIGYLITLQFSHSFITAEVIFFTICACTLSNETDKLSKISFDKLSKIIFSIILLILFIFTIRIYLADIYCEKGLLLVRKGKFKEGIKKLEVATYLNNKEVKYTNNLGRVYFEYGNIKKDIEFIKKATEEYNHSLGIQPTNLETNFALMNNYLILYNASGNKEFLKIAKVFKKRIKILYPNCPVDKIPPFLQEREN